MKNMFIGTWSLKSLESRDVNGNITFPYGKDISGKLMYDENNMMAIIAGDNRPIFKAGDLMRGTDEEKISATSRFVSYTAKYNIIDERTIVHDIKISFFPNWIGEEQKRFYLFNDGYNELELSTDFFPLNGKDQKVVLVWKRE